MNEIAIGIQKDRAQRAFLTDALIEQNRKQQSEEQADHDIEHAEHGEVVQRDAPARLGPYALVLQAGPRARARR